MRRVLLATVVSIGLNGCGLIAASAFAADASEQLGPDRFMVAVGGGAFASHLDEALLYQCAATADRAGFDSFTITAQYVATNGGYALMNASRAVAYFQAFKGVPTRPENSYWVKDLLKSLVAYR